MNEEKKNALTAEADGVIEGRNAVIEALRAGENIDKIFIQKGETDKTLGHIASKARAAGIVVVDADKRKLDGMSRTHAHQGVIALAAMREYVSVEDILAKAAEKGENPLMWCATRSPTPITWAPSSVLPSAPVLTVSSSPSAAAQASPPWWPRPLPAPWRTCLWPVLPTSPPC